MLCMFAMVFNCFCKCFLCLLCMLQALYLYVSKVDRCCTWDARGKREGRERSLCERRTGGAGLAWARVTQVRLSDVQVAWGHAWTRKTEMETDSNRRRPSGRPGASSAEKVNPHTWLLFGCTIAKST
jgi:hypothetical protein